MSPNSSPGGSLVVVRDEERPLPRCTHHPRKELDIYRKRHQEPICVTCTSTRHLACHKAFDAQVATNRELLDDPVAC